jgi:transcriptional regulator with XRE-family HTH domain
MIQYYRPMAIGALILAWRVARGQSLEDVAAKANLSPTVLEKIEAECVDPPVSTIESLAAALKVPVAWLFAHPTTFEVLFERPEEENAMTPDGPDPITDRILAGSRMDRSLYVLLTAILQSGEPKLFRAAEASLRSLVKQSQQATVPWQNRPSGHFEPPNN